MMKAALLALLVVTGCRAQRLGEDPVIRAAFAAQAQPTQGETPKLDATDATLVMARHREPMSPPEAAAAARSPIAGGLQTPSLGKNTP